MNYHSLNHKASHVNFKDAVIKGLAPDRGLYFPENIPTLPATFFEKIGDLSHADIAFEAISPFVEPSIPEDVLKEIISDTLSFDFPLIALDQQVSVLELFHGPTMAFKDVGARFMARCLGYFNQDNDQEVTVLVATSGDTGAAVAHGFLGVKGVKVVILYPSGKVSEIQEKQLTTLGQNIQALEVDGTFDDCQDMVKKAFLDNTLNRKMQLTSANSINVARWLPQMFYFLFAYKALNQEHNNIVFSVPSGNFGNICAGMMAQQMGMPIAHFVAANNENDVVTQYLTSKSYNPKPAVPTISNAMDVGDPSNFIRIKAIYQNDFEKLSQNLSAYRFTNAQTQEAMRILYERYNYVADPHGAVGFAGGLAYLKDHSDAHIVFLETAHPTKFLDIVEEVTKKSIAIPPQIQKVMHGKKQSIIVKTYDDFKTFLLKSQV